MSLFSEHKTAEILVRIVKYLIWAAVVSAGYIYVTASRPLPERNFFTCSPFLMYFFLKIAHVNDRWFIRLLVFSVDKPNPGTNKVLIQHQNSFSYI